AYAADQMAQGVPLHIIVRGLLGLFSGRKGARLWRQQLSDAKLLKSSQATLIANAWRGLGSISV
ncbi:MAG: tRNA dihydrouridine(20/20a) synthase DusA, partial [Burkholderiales bacterium]